MTIHGNDLMGEGMGRDGDGKEQNGDVRINRNEQKKHEKIN